MNRPTQWSSMITNITKWVTTIMLNKWHLLPFARNRNPDTSTHYILVLESPMKTRCWNNTLHREESGQDWFQYWALVPHGHRHAHIRLVPQNEKIHPLPTGDINRGGIGQVPCDTHLNKSKEYTLSLKQGEVFSHKVIGPAQPERTLCLFIRKCLKLKAER